MMILIIGGGIAARRYVESLLWTEHKLCIAGVGANGKSKILSKEYILNYYDFYKMEKETVNIFDMIIVCTALYEKINVLKKIVNCYGYNKYIILEKPLVIGYVQLDEVRKLISKLSYCFVVCQRDYDLDNYKIEISDLYYITWYSIKDSMTENIIHMLPHLLSWLILEFNGNYIELERSKDYLVGAIDGRKIKINFVKSDNTGVLINDTLFRSPNYRILNGCIVDKIFKSCKEDSVVNMKRAVKVVEIVNNLLEE